MRSSRLLLLCAAALQSCLLPGSCGFACPIDPPGQDWWGIGESEYLPWTMYVDDVGCTGGVSDTTRSSTSPSLKFSASGSASILWIEVENPLSPALYLKQLKHEQWVELDGSATKQGISRIRDFASRMRGYDLALGSAGNPHIVWSSDASNHDRVYYTRFNGAVWDRQSTEVSAAPPPGPQARFPRLALTAGESPIVAWTADLSGGAIERAVYLRHLDAGGWMGLVGADTFPGLIPDATLLSIGVDASDRPFVVSNRSALSGTGNEILVMRLEQDAWQTIDEASLSGPEDWPKARSLALDPGGGFVLVWEETIDERSTIYLRWFDGSAWTELAGSATAGGVSDTAGNATNPTVALTPDGSAVVAWSDDSSGNDEIYLKHFEDGSWRSIAGSASGGGVSNSREDSEDPSVAVSDDRICVAWNEREPSPPVDPDDDWSPPNQILLRCTTY